jgi:polygalacturonase
MRRWLIKALTLLLGLGPFSVLAVQAGEPSSEPASVANPPRVTAKVTPGGGSSPAADTVALQQAIDACARIGGGRVEVTAGTYHVTPLQLRSNVDLHLDAGATLLFSRNFDDYPLAWVDDGNGPEAGCRSPIWGEGLANVSITGAGIIDGQGDAWRPVKKEKLSASEWGELVNRGGVTNAKHTEWYPAAIVRDGREALKKLAEKGKDSLDAYVPFRPLLRPNLIRLVDCKNVTLDGVTFRNSASWNVHLALCDQITVHHVTIFNVAWAQNGDGIDLDSCRDVMMTDSEVNAGDDGICLKSGMNEAGRRRARPTENVTIERCTVGTGHGGVVIGSEMSGGVHHVNVSDCTFKGTENGLRFKSTRGRGGVVEDVHVNNIKMSDIHGVAILFDLFYFANGGSPTKTVPPVSIETPAFRDFQLSNITCNGAKLALQIRGLPEMPLQNITLDNVHIAAQSAGFIVDADDITCRDVHIQASDGSLVRHERTKDLKVSDCTGFEPVQ